VRGAPEQLASRLSNASFVFAANVDCDLSIAGLSHNKVRETTAIFPFCFERAARNRLEAAAGKASLHGSNSGS
jgi:hypothetical protein